MASLEDASRDVGQGAVRGGIRGAIADTGIAQGAQARRPRDRRGAP